MILNKYVLKRKLQAVFCGVLITLVGLGALMPSVLVERSVWSIETLDSTGNVGMYTSLALDSQGRPHISYLNSTNHDLKYAYMDSSGWHNETVDSTGQVGPFSSLALDNNGYPHISYHDTTNNDLKYAYMDSGGWHIDTVDSTGDVGAHTSIALDDDGYPHISYHDFTNTDLKYAYWDGVGWHNVIVDSFVTYNGGYTSLALDNDGYPHISYHDGNPNYNLKYAYMDSGGWHIGTVDSTGDVGWYTSLALDTSGYPHISYYDWGNNDLKYAYWDGGSWQIVAVESYDNVGQYTSLALDSSDYPHISYYDVTNGDLKYAYWDSYYSWHKVLVDMSDTVGQYTSLALDSSDYPHISYYDVTNGDLKYAWETGSPEAWVSPAAQTVYSGESFCVNIYINSDGLLVNSAGINLSYPPGFVVTSVTSGDLLGTETIDVGGDMGGYVNYAESRVGNPPAAVNGVFVTICFTAPSTLGVYTLNWNQIDIIDHLGNPILGVVVTGGTVTVESYGGDLFITSFEVIQVINDTDALIKDKKSVVCVEVENTFGYTRYVDFKVTYDFSTKTYVETGPFGNGVPLVSGSNRVYITGGPSNPAYQALWKSSGKGPWLSWSSIGLDNNIKVEVDSSNDINEDNENNNIMTTQKTVYESSGLKVLVVPIYFPFFQDSFTPQTENQEQYLLATYPVPSNNLSWVQIPAMRWDEIPFLPRLDDWLYENVAVPLSITATVLGYDRVVIVIQDLGDWGGIAIGMLRLPDNRVPVFVRDDQLWRETLTAHEIGHTYYLWHPHDIGPPVYDCWEYNVNDREYETRSRTFMSYSSRLPPGVPTNPVWIDKGRYDTNPLEFESDYFTFSFNLFDQFQITRESELMLISGKIFENETIEADDSWYRISPGLSDLEPGSYGDYNVVLLDDQNQVLNQFGFNVTFDFYKDIDGNLTLVHNDTCPFVIKIPYDNDLETIEIRNNTGAILLSRIISDECPAVDIVSPNGGEVFDIGTEINMTWDANDNDSENLTYIVAYSLDGGNNWMPITSGINTTYYLWDTANLSWVDMYMLKVIASDGLNTGEDTSNETFTLQPSLDYSGISFKDKTEIPDIDISTNYTLTCCASGYNNTYGFIEYLDVNWTLVNTESNATINTSIGKSIIFNSGWYNGTANLSIDGGNGHNDSVELTINSSLFSVLFYEGWNLVTVPFDNSWTAETLGKNISGCTTVCRFNASSQSYITHVVGIPYNEFPILDATGYFVYCAQDSIFSLPDLSITSVNVSIFEDWNIVGWYHDYATTAESLGENISDCTVVCRFNADSQSFTTHVVNIPYNDFLIERGMALFIYATDASYWYGEG